MILVVAFEWCYQIDQKSVDRTVTVMPIQIQCAKPYVRKCEQHRVDHQGVDAKQQHRHQPVREQDVSSVFVEEHKSGIPNKIGYVLPRYVLDLP